ncbi:MAG: ATP-binding protein [Candidatus Methanoplasma sp.]|jgi:SpoVK/Ycf46/Vps4 family AAA+-type ATPase|nr:ATP-binding protein [Candidatus Methanoplasma sp.]
MDYSNEVIRIVEGALKSDKVKVSSYTKLLIDKLTENGEMRLAKTFEKLMKNDNKVTQMSVGDVMKIPIDQESRLPMADAYYPHNDSIDVILNSSANNQIEKFITYTRNTNKLLNSGITVPNSIILFGPPGCGKSRAATYISDRTKLPLVTARLDTMISSYLGSTSKNIRAIFEYAKSTPCILFLDEFDAIAKVRDDNNELGELKRVVNSLLQNIDRLKNGSIIVAATNHEHLLDPAVWRRFGFKINVDLPDVESRKRLVDLFLQGNGFSAKDLEIASAVTMGSSGADIEEICNKTSIDSILSDKEISISSFLESVFDFNGICDGNDDNVSKKQRLSSKARFLRSIDEKLFSYSQIASLLGFSKTYVSNLVKEAGD